MLAVDVKKNVERPQSWKVINENRKALKKQRKQEKVLKELERAKKAEELAKVAEEAEAPKVNPSTISIAIPGSILENAQSAELRSYVAGQVARAACIFRVHEVIVYDDVCVSTARETKQNYDESNGSTVRSSSLQLARILQYLECPQYLRKFFFPLHNDLKYSGLLNPLDAPHHLRQQHAFLYREGIVTDKPAKQGQKFVNVGLLNEVLVDQAVEEGLRVTVKLNLNVENKKKLRGSLVSPDEPRRETGVYWGYTVRIAHSISEIFTKTPYKDGYDLSIGTSDKGKNVQGIGKHDLKFNHLLIVFGGLKGLEAALANDDKLDIEDPELLFDHYLNVLPRQGSRTIRTEEAVLVAMAALQEKLCPQNEEMEEMYKDLLPSSEDTGFTPYIQNNKKPKKRKFAEHTTIGDKETSNEFKNKLETYDVDNSITSDNNEPPNKFKNKFESHDVDNSITDNNERPNKFKNKFRSQDVDNSITDNNERPNKFKNKFRTQDVDNSITDNRETPNKFKNKFRRQDENNSIIDNNERPNKFNNKFRTQNVDNSITDNRETPNKFKNKFRTHNKDNSTTFNEEKGQFASENDDFEVVSAVHQINNSAIKEDSEDLSRFD
ncbi:putative methyltransferase C9orf114 [Teleopsis dalmanni]|uniref:putative methyltransferase C9orf114 n=1 Tax=Teleopsis dalmanni TaxID=139649 RepID=UPI0018CD0BF9|nr:putative methyltransferase C9orf114 [Teleopsis dalmanni]